MDLSKVPTWAWVAGGGVVLVGAVLITRRGSSSTGTGSVDTSGQSSPFTDSLAALMTAISNLQGALPGVSGGGGGGGGSSSTGTGSGSTGGSGGQGGITVSPQPPKPIIPPQVLPFKPSNPITGPGGIAQPFPSSLKPGSLSPRQTVPVVTASKVIRAPVPAKTQTTSKPIMQPAVHASYVSKYTKMLGNTRVFPISPTPTRPIAVKAPSPTTTRITSGPYAGKIVPL